MNEDLIDLNDLEKSIKLNDKLFNNVLEDGGVKQACGWLEIVYLRVDFRSLLGTGSNPVVSKTV